MSVLYDGLPPIAHHLQFLQPNSRLRLPDKFYAFVMLQTDFFFVDVAK